MNDKALYEAVTAVMADPEVVGLIAQKVHDRLTQPPEDTVGLDELTIILGHDVDINKKDTLGVLVDDITAADPHLICWSIHEETELTCDAHLRQRLIETMRAHDCQSNTPYPVAFIEKTPSE